VFRFPDGLYSDVRIEEIHQTRISFAFGKIQEMLERTFAAAFIRVYDGQRWYYSSTSSLNEIQEHIYTLSNIAIPSPSIEADPIVKKLEANRAKTLLFVGDEDTGRIPLREKYAMLSNYFPVIESHKSVRFWIAQYIDEKKTKRFFSSKGAELEFDYQRAGIHFGYEMGTENNQVKDSFNYGNNYYRNMSVQDKKLQYTLNRSIDFLKRAKNIESGRYPVILSPMAAGIFAHESFGHLSETDTFRGDETFKNQWIIGKKVADESLSIVDDGTSLGMGYTPFDDEGTKSKKTYLIRRGVLVGRLHNAATAADFNESLTGNSRSESYEYEPIVRMTNTYIEPGEKSLCQLIGEVEHGFLIETIVKGNGLTNFTLTPLIAYRIRKGTIAEPVKISVITGNSFETLFKIDGISDHTQLAINPFISCSKGEQHDLPIDFGGPYVRISEIDVLG
jgi:TldD protein